MGISDTPTVLGEQVKKRIEEKGLRMDLEDNSMLQLEFSLIEVGVCSYVRLRVCTCVCLCIVQYLETFQFCLCLSFSFSHRRTVFFL